MVSKIIVNQKLKSTKQKWSVAPLGFCTYNLLLIASEKGKGEVDETKHKEWVPWEIYIEDILLWLLWWYLAITSPRMGSSCPTLMMQELASPLIMGNLEVKEGCFWQWQTRLWTSPANINVVHWHVILIEYWQWLLSKVRHFYSLVWMMFPGNSSEWAAILLLQEIPEICWIWIDLFVLSAGMIQEGHIRKPSWFYDKTLEKFYFIKFTF